MGNATNLSSPVTVLLLKMPFDGHMRRPGLALQERCASLHSILHRLQSVSIGWEIKQNKTKAQQNPECKSSYIFTPLLHYVNHTTAYNPFLTIGVVSSALSNRVAVLHILPSTAPRKSEHQCHT